jgi:mannose-6-phosphate isomerase-like protein (cupin superfamily)
MLMGIRKVTVHNDALRKTENMIKLIRVNDHNDEAKSRKENPLMFIRDLKDCAEFIAADNSILREILHPDKADLALRYSLAHAIVRPGQTTKPHRLKTSEVYYIVAGEGVMHIDGEAGTVRPGSTIYIPPRTTQFIRNSGKTDLVFLCIVDPAWRKEDEEILQQW